MSYRVEIAGSEKKLAESVSAAPQTDELQEVDLWNYCDSEGRAVTVERLENDREYRVYHMGETVDLVVSDTRDLRGDTLLGATSSGRSRSTVLRAPMPGLLKEILVEVGDMVTKGDSLCILEAMKMENELRATGEFRVASIGVEAGGPVEKGTVLITLDPVE